MSEGLVTLHDPLRTFWFLSKTHQLALRARRENWENFDSVDDVNFESDRYQEHELETLLDTNDGDEDEHDAKTEQRFVFNAKLEWLLFHNPATKFDFLTAYIYTRTIDAYYYCSEAYPYDSCHCRKKMQKNLRTDMFSRRPFKQFIPDAAFFAFCVICNGNWTEADLHFILKSLGIMTTAAILLKVKEGLTTKMVSLIFYIAIFNKK